MADGVLHRSTTRKGDLSWRERNKAQGKIIGERRTDISCYVSCQALQIEPKQACLFVFGYHRKSQVASVAHGDLAGGRHFHLSARVCIGRKRPWVDRCEGRSGFGNCCAAFLAGCFVIVFVTFSIPRVWAHPGLGASTHGGTELL